MCGYRAFPAAWGDTLALGPGRHLLLHGENGSGKSSLGLALRDLLDPRTEAEGAVPFTQVRHVFDDQTFTGGHVTLHFDDDTAPMAWTYNGAAAGQFRPTAHALWDPMARSAAWMDYQRLRRLYEAGAGQFLDDIFPICRDLLLVDVPLSETNPVCFSAEWKAICEQASIRRPIGPRASYLITALRRRINLFNAALAGFIQVWQAAANRLLPRFVDSTELTFEPPTDATYNYVTGRGAGWRLTAPKLRLHLRYRGHVPTNPLAFLNEARLTACALALWFAALLRTRPRTLAPGQTYPRVLVLDDVLLGLDMDHRRPLLEVLEGPFAEWQVLLLTHNRAWYELARQRLPEDWHRAELFAVRVGDHEAPLLKDDEDHLYRALHFLGEDPSTARAIDVKAAAVHLRTKMELIVKAACEDFNIRVPYQRDVRQLQLSTLWGFLIGHEQEFALPPRWISIGQGRQKQLPGKRVMLRIVPPEVARRVALSLSWVLNPLSHSQTVERHRGEMLDAAFALDDLERALNYARRGQPLDADDLRQRLLRLIAIGPPRT